MKYGYEKASAMIAQGHRLEVYRSSKQVRARVVSSNGSVLGNVAPAVREMLLANVPLTILSKEPRRTVWTYDYAYVAAIQPKRRCA